MSVQKQMNPHFEVKVHVTYVESESRPDQNQYFFAYKVNITNKSTAPAQLMSRHWIITDSIGQVEEVRGAGVVAFSPRFNPAKVLSTKVPARS